MARTGEADGLAFWSCARALLLALATLCASACGTATYILQQYNGPVRPQDQIGILRINGGSGLEISYLDGKPLGIVLQDESARIHIEMLPGVHRLSVANPAEFGRPSEVRFRVEPNQVYRVGLESVPVRHGSTTRTATRALVYEIDRDSDEVLRDASIRGQRLSPQTPAGAGSQAQPPPPIPPAEADGLEDDAPAEAPPSTPPPTEGATPPVSPRGAPVPPGGAGSTAPEYAPPGATVPESAVPGSIPPSAPAAPKRAPTESSAPRPAPTAPAPSP
jgi:hypothetical protein